MVFDIDGTPVAAGGTFRFIRAGADAPAFKRAAVFVCIFHGIVSPGAHFMPFPAEGMPFLVKSDIIRGIFRRLCPPVDVNEGIDVPSFQKLISRDVVMRGVEADVFW